MAKVTCPHCFEETEVPRTIEVTHGGVFDCTECSDYIGVVPLKRSTMKLRDNGGPWKGGWLTRKA